MLVKYVETQKSNSKLYLADQCAVTVQKTKLYQQLLLKTDLKREKQVNGVKIPKNSTSKEILKAKKPKLSKTSKIIEVPDVQQKIPKKHHSLTRRQPSQVREEGKRSGKSPNVRNLIARSVCRTRIIVNK